ncbi:MAG: DNA-processing protein DprA, partial [Sphingomonas parapaucimobilis]
MTDARFAQLRLLRTHGIGPVTWRQLMARFGEAEAALDALPQLARRGGGEASKPADPALIAREIETVARLGARHVLLGEADYPALLA